MSGWMIFLIALGLAMDCFAVSLGIGTSGNANSLRSVSRLVFHFGLFQAGMTWLGWLAGKTILTYIASFDHWLVFALLGFVGVKMIIESFQNADDDKPTIDPSRGFSLVILSVATSLDALAVGISLALLEVNITVSCIIIGLVSSALSLAGLLAGDFLGKKFGKRMELLGGLILIGIGLRILISHFGA